MQVCSLEFRNVCTQFTIHVFSHVVVNYLFAGVKFLHFGTVKARYLFDLILSNCGGGTCAEVNSS